MRVKPTSRALSQGVVAAPPRREPQWLQSMQEPLKKYGPQMLAYVTRVYQEPWMVGGFAVNISGWSN